MTKYDDSSWHSEGNFPSGIPLENGATHIGYFLTWCIKNNMISDFQLEENEDDVHRVLQHTMTGREFLLQNCDGKFTDEDLNEDGNAFASDYYNEESDFSKKVGSYLSNYEVAIQFFSQETGMVLETSYHLEDSWEFYEGIKIMLDERFSQWKKFKKLD